MQQIPTIPIQNMLKSAQLLTSGINMLMKELQALIKACTSASSQEFKAYLQTVEMKYAHLSENQELPRDDFIASLPNVLLIKLELPLLTQLKAYLWPLSWENAGGIAITECGSSVSQTQPNSVPIVYLALVILKNIVSYLTDDQNTANLKLVSKKFYYTISGNLHILAPRFLQTVTWGKQTSVESMIQNYPVLLTMKAHYIDHADREIYCTGYQRAMWDGDWYMFQMMEKYLLVGGNHQYPARFNFNPVLAAYTQYIATPSAHLWLLLAKEQAALPIFILQILLQLEHAFNYNRETYYERSFNRNTQLENGTDMLDENCRRDFGVRFGLFRHHENVLSSTENPGEHVLEDIKRELTCLQQLASCAKKIEHHFEYPRGLPI